MNGLKVEGQPSVYIYTGPNDSGFVLIKADLDSGDDGPSRDQFRTKLEQGAKKAEDSGQLADVRVVSRTIKGAGGPAFEVVGTGEQLGETMTLRTLAVLSNDRAYVFIATGDSDTSLVAEHEWSSFLASLEVNTDSGILPPWALYGLGGLALLGLLLLLQGKGSPSTRPYVASRASSAVSNGGARSRATDGLPRYDGGPLQRPHLDSHPSALPTQRPLGVARTLPPLKPSRPTPPGLSRTIPSQDGP